MTTVEEERRKQPSVLRTIRLSSDLDCALTKEAEKKKIGKNALIVSILNKYVEWDSVVETFLHDGPTRDGDDVDKEP